MFSHLQLSDRRERWLVGLADLLLVVPAGLARLWPRRSPVGTPPAILIFRLERIGDLLMTLDAIRAVRARAPEARIDLVVGSWNLPIARAIPDVDRVESLDMPWLARETPAAKARQILRQIGIWRSRRYALAINFEGDIRSHLLMWLGGAERRVGFTMAGGGPLLTDRVPYNPTEHVAANALRLVDAACGPAAGVPADSKGSHVRLDLPADARARASELLASQAPANAPSTPAGSQAWHHRPLVGLHASGGREIKQWAPDRFAAVAAGLSVSHGATIVLTGAAADRALVDRVRHALPATVRTIDLAGRADLLTLAAVLERLDLLVTGDTGPMHLAAAVGTPIVAIFGPSDPARWGPLGSRARIVRAELACCPCNRIRRPPERCVGRLPDCLAAVRAEDVLAAARALLDETGNREVDHAW